MGIGGFSVLPALALVVGDQQDDARDGRQHKTDKAGNTAPEHNHEQLTDTAVHGVASHGQDLQRKQDVSNDFHKVSSFYFFFAALVSGHCLGMPKS